MKVALQMQLLAIGVLPEELVDIERWWRGMVLMSPSYPQYLWFSAWPVRVRYFSGYPEAKKEMDSSGSKESHFYVSRTSQGNADVAVYASKTDEVICRAPLPRFSPDHTV